MYMLLFTNILAVLRMPLNMLASAVSELFTPHHPQVVFSVTHRC